MRSSIFGFLANGDFFIARLLTKLVAITVHNTGSATQEIALTVQKDGQEFDLAHVELKQNEIATYEDEIVLKKDMSLRASGVTGPITFILGLETY